MIWFKSPHSMEWKPSRIVSWTEKYEDTILFLKDFPELEEVFN